MKKVYFFYIFVLPFSLACSASINIKKDAETAREEYFAVMNKLEDAIDSGIKEGRQKLNIYEQKVGNLPLDEQKEFMPELNLCLKLHKETEDEHNRQDRPNERATAQRLIQSTTVYSKPEQRIIGFAPIGIPHKPITLTSSSSSPSLLTILFSAAKSFSNNNTKQEKQ